MPLLKDVDDRGLVFYTNLESRKGRQINDNRGHRPVSGGGRSCDSKFASRVRSSSSASENPTSISASIRGSQIEARHRARAASSRRARNLLPRRRLSPPNTKTRQYRVRRTGRAFGCWPNASSSGENSLTVYMTANFTHAKLMVGLSDYTAEAVLVTGFACLGRASTFVPLILQHCKIDLPSHLRQQESLFRYDSN